MRMRTSALLVVPLCLAAAVGCSGGSTGAGDDAAAAAKQAKAACDLFVNFKPPKGSGANSQIDYAKATYGAFLKAADLAGQAAAQDPRWKALESAAAREAAGFEIIVKGAEGTTQLDMSRVNNAVAETKAARPLFIAECAKADPATFGTATQSPSATATSTATKPSQRERSTR
jgi:hypothetical protein